jgi:cobalt/nickel transport system permease protein
MHIASGFLSLPVWGAAAAISGAALAASMAAARRHLDDRKVPLMGVMGAFVFAAQMVNFPILPGTSGHLGGGFLLGILLGPSLGIVVMASVLVVQSLVFQDGGLEALGANILVMGVLPCLLGGTMRGLWLRPRPGAVTHILTAAAGALGVLAGATGVVVMLWLSDALPKTLSLLHAVAAMDFIHLWIGIVEGAVSVAVVRFVLATRREAVVGDEPLDAVRKAA